jgi:cytochrome c biogenesis protein CcmG, thiol:disulfide interchange protein DsbE
VTGAKRLFLLVPVLAFAVLAGVFFAGLFSDPSRLPSTLINKPAPEFVLAAVDGLDRPGLSRPDLNGKGVTVMNIWASWCGPCREEHPILMLLSKRQDIRLVGINNKDLPENARRFLGALGNPFSAVGSDPDGRVTIDWGGYGVPETFIVDGNGVIRHKHVGALSADDLIGDWAAEIEKAKVPL